MHSFLVAASERKERQVHLVTTMHFVSPALAYHFNMDSIQKEILKEIFYFFCVCAESSKSKACFIVTSTSQCGRPVFPRPQLPVATVPAMQHSCHPKCGQWGPVTLASPESRSQLRGLTRPPPPQCCG